mmetsp:Transcript_20014/g.48763  ORF Transcript_20014/g.48763 Transcript_20014/m.48763 type:complete len:371 (+) Transcript_20014:31-1143(+)
MLPSGNLETKQPKSTGLHPCCSPLAQDSKKILHLQRSRTVHVQGLEHVNPLRPGEPHLSGALHELLHAQLPLAVGRLQPPLPELLLLGPVRRLADGYLELKHPVPLGQGGGPPPEQLLGGLHLREHLRSDPSHALLHEQASDPRAQELLLHAPDLPERSLQRGLDDLEHPEIQVFPLRILSGDRDQTLHHTGGEKLLDLREAHRHHDHCQLRHSRSHVQVPLVEVQNHQHGVSPRDPPRAGIQERVYVVHVPSYGGLNGRKQLQMERRILRPRGHRQQQALHAPPEGADPPVRAQGAAQHRAGLENGLAVSERGTPQQQVQDDRHEPGLHGGFLAFLAVCHQRRQADHRRNLDLHVLKPVRTNHSFDGSG